MGNSFAPLLNWPFYEGVSISEDTPYYLPVSIANHSYLLDLRQYERQTIPPIRPPQDNSAEPGEQSLNQEGFWRRSQSSWHLGAGQEYFDAEDSARQRFYTSKGIDPWTKYKLQLLNDTEKKAVAGFSASSTLTLQVGIYLYVADGTAVKFTADPTPSAPTVSNSGMGSSGNFLSLTTDGATIWGVNTTGIRQNAAGATTGASTLAAGTYTLVGYANGRLLAANQDVLYEISRAGTPTTVWDHPNPDFDWTVIAASPSAIYVAGTCVDRSEIYSLTALDATGALAAPVLATTLPDGETIRAIQFYGGAVLLGTSRGLRLALVGSNNTLTFGPVITIPNGVNAFEGQGEYVWFGWTNYDGVSTGLGRANLADFTRELVPAYASDLMATGQGTVLSVSTVGTRRYFAVSGLGIYGETAAPVASGVIDIGKIRYGTTEKKIATSLDLRHEPLPASGEIAVTVSTEEGASTAIGSSETVGSLSPASPLGINIPQTEAIGIQLTLSGDPVLRRWTLYSRVTPILSDEIIAPLIVHDYVLSDLGEGQKKWYSPLDEYRFLKALADNKSIQVYQEGDSAYTVYVTGVRVKPEDWNVDRSFFNGTLFVRMVTVNTS